MRGGPHGQPPIAFRLRHRGHGLQITGVLGMDAVIGLVHQCSAGKAGVYIAAHNVHLFANVARACMDLYTVVERALV